MTKGGSGSEESSQDPDETPTSTPKPIYRAITVAPASEIETSTHAPVPAFTGSGAILQGYCSEPAYTILDGPTVFWVPVIGCISSKSDCCASSNGPAATGTDAGVPPPAFPTSSFAEQGILKICPSDYHTVGGTGCCPS